MTDNVGGRFQVITGQPQAKPGACLVCRGIEGPFIDTLQGDDWLGGFFFCYNCVKEMSTVLAITVDENKLEQVKAYNQGSRDMLSGVQRHLNELFTSLDFSSVTPDAPSSLTVSGGNDADDQGNAESESGSDTDGTSADRIELEGAGSPFDEGPDSVPSGTGDGLAISA